MSGREPLHLLMAEWYWPDEERGGYECYGSYESRQMALDAAQMNVDKVRRGESSYVAMFIRDTSLDPDDGKDITWCWSIRSGIDATGVSAHA